MGSWIHSNLAQVYPLDLWPTKLYALLINRGVRSGSVREKRLERRIQRTLVSHIAWFCFVTRNWDLMACIQVLLSLGGNLLDPMPITCFKCYGSYSFVDDIECVLLMLVDIVNDSFNAHLLSLKSNNMNNVLNIF